MSSFEERRRRAGWYAALGMVVACLIIIGFIAIAVTWPVALLTTLLGIGFCGTVYGIWSTIRDMYCHD